MCVLTPSPMQRLGSIRSDRPQQLKQKFTVRGAVRGASLGLCALNVAGGGLAYVFGRREKEEASK